eukprot:CAMPEP_0118962264 /NCGR_PEP_ID=MMETSP1173-20130426/668_1 /TAXON_ID=1034831 /ORGANISM="Rhizochromulina marina cf, Strain CCMP1243" /LENGTH=173 /DNA_ID=CAMNT_0006910511 /DNA_START=72 /DNA_END=590 /DNA_ORIENTATION=+
MEELPVVWRDASLREHLQLPVSRAFHATCLQFTEDDGLASETRLWVFMGGTGRGGFTEAENLQDVWTLEPRTWSPEFHRFFPRSFQRIARLWLLIHARQDSVARGLDIELWMRVLQFARADWWAESDGHEHDGQFMIIYGVGDRAASAERTLLVSVFAGSARGATMRGAEKHA